MRVVMLKQTYFNGQKSVGEEYEVPNAVALRWAKRGIAEVVGEIIEDLEPVEPVKQEYSGMKPKELYDLCVERGIEVEARQKPEYYINLLIENDAVTPTSTEE